MEMDTYVCPLLAKKMHLCCIIGLLIVLFISADAKEKKVIQAKLGDTANFTWSYAKFTSPVIKVGPSLRGRMTSILGYFENSKAEINPNLSNDLRSRYEFVGNVLAKSVSLLLKNVGKDDNSTEFKISITTPSRIHEEIATLEIVVPPKFAIKPTSRSEVNEGTKLSLKCMASGTPSPKIEWKAKGSTVVLASGIGSKELLFNSINRRNQSEYQCIATNVAGKVKETAQVIVNYIPTIDAQKSSKTVYSYVGNPNPVKLECFADGRPTPTYFWQDHFGVNISYQSTYSLVNPKDDELGFSYKCFAANKVGLSKAHLVRVEKLEKPGKVEAQLREISSRFIAWRWNLPSETGGAPLAFVIVRVTHPGGVLKNYTFTPDVRNRTFGNLMPYRKYSFEFVAENQVLRGLPMKYDVTTNEEAPGVPQNLKEGEPSVKRQLSIQWSPPKEANGLIRGYEVAYRRKKVPGPKPEAITKKNTTNTHIVLKNLAPYEEYLVQVRAVTIEPGLWTKRKSFTTPMEAPSVPRNLTCGNVEARNVLITWKKPEFIYGLSGTLEVTYELSMDGKRFSEKKPLYNEQREWKLVTRPFTDYEVRVRESVGSNLWGPFSPPCTFKTKEGEPSAPRDVKITHRTTRSISLRWIRPEYINGILKSFTIFYENATQRYEEKVEQDLGNNTFVHRLYNLNLDTKYTIMVQGFTNAGGGEISNPVETSTRSTVAAPRKKPNDEIAAGPIIGGIFSFLVILVLLIILILYIARKQRLSKSSDGPEFCEESPPADQRLIPPAQFDEKVPDVVTTNGKMPLEKRNSYDDRPTRERCFISSRPIRVDELKEVCDRLHANKDTGFIQEFKGITPRQNDQTWDICLRKENKCKNRYNNILAYDHSRVILSYIENIPGSDYINANFIDGYSIKKQFIATQGPVAASFNDFWRMVWEQNSEIIVMVTNLIEKSRIKCQKYWPTGEPREYGSIRVAPEEEMELAEYVVRKFSISMVSANKRHGTRKVTQFQFTGWPDHGVPQYATGLLQFIRKIRAADENASGPIISHCSAGVGRSGTFITLHAMLDQAMKEGTVDVHGFVSHIRSQRNYMVQTEAQYIFIHDALLEAVICGNTEVNVKDLANRMRSLEQVNPETNRTLLEEEFERLSYNLAENHIYQAGFLEVNASKNRFASVVPIESTRLKLWPYPDIEGSDYINANFVDGYQLREAFILTQAPMENTVEDFWRMIWEYEVFSIVMLSSGDEHDETHCFPYWPFNAEPANIGLLIIQIAAEENKTGFVKREFRATNSKTGETRVITHFMYYDWPEDKSPDDPSLLIAMIGQLQKAQQMTGNSSIAVHCSDGCGRSGAIAATMFCIERLKVEGIVDVFQTVRMMRTQRPHVIRTLDQYLYCYKAVQKFVDKFSDYANFK